VRRRSRASRHRRDDAGPDDDVARPQGWIEAAGESEAEEGPSHRGDEAGRALRGA